jgi:hypothetical protein
LIENTVLIQPIFQYSLARDKSCGHFEAAS